MNCFINTHFALLWVSKWVLNLACGNRFLQNQKIFFGTKIF